MENESMVSRELTDQDRARLVELDEAIVKFEGQKRWSDVIKSVIAKAEIVVDPEEKVSLYSQAGTMYLEKSSNQAEAIKCFEHVIDLEPSNVQAITQLREMYEKRRDWEKLVRIMEREASLLDPSDRGFRYVEIAQLATEKIRKPEVCIGLWQQVLEHDPDQGDALTALAGLYERAREWEPLARVLERQAEQVVGGDDQKALLAKLGMIYADKLNDDRGAVGAFQRLLALDPDDKRAQEQLKRRYVAIKAWDDLEEFYAASEKWDELIRTLEREAGNKESPKEEQVDLYFRVARLWERQEKADRAAKAYEKVLEIDPESRQAAEALTPIYEGAGDAKKLAGVYEVRLRHLASDGDTGERVGLLREAGVLYEEKLKKPDLAFDKYLDALSLDPGQEVLREDVARLAAGVNGWDRVIATYSTAIASTSDSELTIGLRNHLGAVLVNVGRVEDAIVQYRGVYDLDPSNEQAVAALEQLYRQVGKHTELLEIYDRRLELETDVDARRRLAYGRASLLETEIGDAERAVDAYREIIAEWGDDEADAYRALDALFEKLGRYQDLADALERRIDLGPSSDEELAALKFRFARVLDQRLNDKARALDLLREVVTIIPEHGGARAALEEMLPIPELGVSAAQILEPIYESTGDWESLIRALEVLVVGATEANQKLELLTKIGEVAGAQIGDPRRAFEAFSRALREVPENEDTLARLESIAAAQSWFGDLVALVSELAAAASENPDLARRLYIRAAQLRDTQLSDVDGAVASYRKVLEQDPTDEEVLAALEELYRRTQRHRDLLGVLRKRAELSADPETQELLLAQVADLHDAVLEEPQQAIGVYREILELDPTSRRALGSLDALFEKQSMWTDLADNIGRQLQIATDPDDQTQLMLRLAQLRESRMGEVDAAIEIHREVLGRDPSNADAIGALERLLDSPRHQLAVTDILEAIYRDANEFAKLIRVLEIQTQHASSPERRVELLHRIAELYEIALDDAPKASESFARALAEDASNATTQEQLERLAEQTGNFEFLAGVYEERHGALIAARGDSTEASDDVHLANQLLSKAAQIREERLQDLARPIAHYQRVLSLDPTSVDAASALERLFHQSEQYEPLAQILLRKADMLEVVDDKKDHLSRAAAIFEEILERPLDAIAVHERVLTVDPEDIPALDKLIELNLRLERWNELLGVYTRKADVVADPDEKKSLYLEVGAVYERELSDTPKAIDTYQRILEIDPDDLTAIQRLDALYVGTGNWQELRQILEREAELASEPNDVISYRFRIADLWHHQLEDASKAVEGYAEILESMPDHQPTLDALEALIRENKEAVRAATTLEGVYQQIGDGAKLVAVLEVQVAHEEDARRRVELLHRIAELHEIQLESPANAFQAFARALPFDSADEHTLTSLERLAGDLEKHTDVTALYDRELDRLNDRPERIVELGLRVAQIYEVQVGDVEAAIERYKRVVVAEEANTQAIESLDRLYEATGKHEELAGILAREAQFASSPDQVLDFQYRLGQVQQRHLGRVDLAIQQYREILAAAPEHESSLHALEELFAAGVEPLQIAEILEPLYRMSEAWDRLIGVQTVQLQHLTDANDRVAMMHRIAEIAEDRAGDAQTAYEWHQRVLLEDAHNERSNGDAERLAGSLGQWEQLADTLASVLGTVTQTDLRVEAGHRLARIYETEINDIARAVDAHLFVLTASPADADALEALDRIYSENGASHALQEVLARRASGAPNDRERVEFLYRRGQVLENDLARIDDAIAVYEEIVDRYDAEHADSIAALANIFTERQDWARLYRAFERELAVALGDSGKADVLARMARLAEDYLGDDARATTLWSQVLELRGEEAEALNALGNLYAKAQRWQELVEVLDREASVTADDDSRVKIFADLGRVFYGKLKSERSALDSWQRVLDIDPTHTGALFAIAEIHRNAGQTSELVETLHRVIDVGAATLEDDAIEAVYMELGALYEEKLQQPADAIDSFNKALDIAPNNFAAMDALERLYAGNAEWVDMIQIRERRADALEDADQKIPVLLSIASTWADQANDPDRGTHAYERVLSLEPTHPEAFTRLERLHTQAERWEELAELYLNRIDSAEESKQRVELLRKVAGVQEKHLGDRQQAYDALLLAWEEDYTDTKTVEELERVTAAAQKWNELLQSAQAAVQGATDTKIRIAISLALARWYGTQLGHPEYAVPYYQQVLTLDRGNVAAMRQMADLYRSTQQWSTLAAALAQLVNITTQPNEKAAVYVQLGDLAEAHLGQPDKARGYYQQAIQTDPHSIEGLEALERVYRASGEWNELLDVLNRKADALTDPNEVLLAKLQIAEAYEERTGNVDDAIATYQQVLATDPTSLRALKGLERLYAARERWPDLLQILERQFEVVSSEKERIAVLLRIAGMWEEEFLKPDRAAERLEQVLEVDPTNETALTGLERLYRHMQRWDQLIATYERHVSATADRTEKQNLLLSVGATYATELQDLDRATDAYLNVLSFNGDNVAALDQLAQIHDKRGDHSQALDTMQQLSRLLTAPEQVVDLRFRMGKLLDEKLGDRASAVDAFQSALDVEPGHLPSLGAMRRIYADAGDWLAAARSLEQEAQYQQQPRVIARSLVELGRLYDERLDEHDRAVEVYEAALRQDPDNEDAALPLAQEYMAKERFDEALPLLDALVKRSGKRETHEQQRLAFMLGEAAQRTNNGEAAIKALTKAHTLDQQHLPTLLALSKAYYDAAQWEQAFKYYQMVLVHHRDGLGRDELTDVFYRLGIVKREQGDRRKALNMFDKALEETPQHRPSIDALIGLYESQNDWEQVIHFKKQIVDIVDGDERLNTLEQIGDLWNEKLRNAPKAVEVYGQAVDVDPTNRRVLHKLLVLHQQTKQWDSAIDVIERISALGARSEAAGDAAAQQQATYAYTIASILRDEVKDADRALEYFNKALDLDPSRLKAFEAINKILNSRKDWKGLERAFRKMLLRVKSKPNLSAETRELEFNLWHNLGVIYRDRLKQPETAVEAFKGAVAVQPDNIQEHVILAELFAATPGRTLDAVNEHQWLLGQEPMRVESYQALYRLYFELREYDKAWCVASALSFMGRADDEQRGFYEQYRERTPRRVTAGLDSERWLTELRHPDADLIVGKMFAQLAPAILALKGKSDRDAGLSPKYLVDLNTHTGLLPQSFRHAAQVLGMATPRLYLRPELAGGLTHLAVSPPASLCGSTLLTGFQPADLMFLSARHVADYLPEHYVRTLMPSNLELRALLMASLRITGVVQAPDPQADALAQQIAPRLAPPQVSTLDTLGRRFVQAGARTDVKKWLQGAELTACRAGLLVCNDVGVAVNMVRQLGSTGPVDLPTQDKITDLLRFGVSESYFRIRAALGLQIQIR